MFNFNTPEVTVQIDLRKNNKVIVQFFKFIDGKRTKIDIKSLNPDEQKLLKKQSHIALAQATMNLDDIFAKNSTI